MAGWDRNQMAGRLRKSAKSGNRFSHMIFGKKQMHARGEV